MKNWDYEARFNLKTLSLKTRPCFFTFRFTFCQQCLFVTFLILLVLVMGNHSWAQHRLILSGKPPLYLQQSNTSEKQVKIDPWFGKDKFDHFLLSAFLVNLMYYSLRNHPSIRPSQARLFSASISLGFGVGKELWDKKSKKGFPSYRDFVADLLGVGLGLLICSQDY